jgi:hypothetical protein
VHRFAIVRLELGNQLRNTEKFRKNAISPRGKNTLEKAHAVRKAVTEATPRERGAFPSVGLGTDTWKTYFRLAYSIFSLFQWWKITETPTAPATDVTLHRRLACRSGNWSASTCSVNANKELEWATEREPLWRQRWRHTQMHTHIHTQTSRVRTAEFDWGWAEERTKRRNTNMESCGVAFTFYFNWEISSGRVYVNAACAAVSDGVEKSGESTFSVEMAPLRVAPATRIDYIWYNRL